MLTTSIYSSSAQIEPYRIAAADGQPLQHLELKLKSLPTASRQQFRLRLRLTNGEVYTAETVPLTLLP